MLPEVIPLFSSMERKCEFVNSKYYCSYCNTLLNELCSLGRWYVCLKINRLKFAFV